MSLSIRPTFLECFDGIDSCKGIDNINYNVYLATNESNRDETFQILSTTPPQGNTVVGVSCFFLLNAVAKINLSARFPDAIEHIVLIDVSTRVQHFWQQMELIICSSADATTCKKRIELLLDKEKEFYYKGREGRSRPADILKNNLQHLQKEIRLKESWLSSEEQFLKIKTIFDNHQVIFKRINLCHPTTCEKLARVLQRQEFKIHTLYLSNTWEYTLQLYPHKREKYLQSIRSLLFSTPLIVQTEPRSSDSIVLKQTVQHIPADASIETLKRYFSYTTYRFVPSPKRSLPQLTPELEPLSGHKRRLSLCQEIDDDLISMPLPTASFNPPLRASISQQQGALKKAHSQNSAPQKVAGKFFSAVLNQWLG